jgi:hypothetical protein
VGISATNRNFRGRMGSPDAEVSVHYLLIPFFLIPLRSTRLSLFLFLTILTNLTSRQAFLASPSVVAESAIAGYIKAPGDAPVNGGDVLVAEVQEPSRCKCPWVFSRRVLQMCK